MTNVWEKKRAFGTKVRAARYAKALTMNELAGEIGVSIAAVSNYETGVASPGLWTFQSICRVLGRSADELLAD